MEDLNKWINNNLDKEYTDRQKLGYKSQYKKLVNKQRSLSHQINHAKKEFESDQSDENYYELMSLAKERQNTIEKKEKYKDIYEDKISINMEGITKRFKKEKLKEINDLDKFIYKKLEQNVMNKARGVIKRKQATIAELNSAVGLAKRIEGATTDKKTKETAKKLKNTLLATGATVRGTLKDESKKAPILITKNRDILNINYL